MPTKLEDAKSIVEDEEVLKDLELKSLAEDVLVIKTDDKDEDDCPEGDKECEKKRAAMKEEKSVAENTVVSTPTPVAISYPSDTVLISTPAIPVVPVVSETPVQKSVALLIERVNALKTQGVSGDAALAELQKEFDALGTVVKAEFTPVPTAQEVAKNDLAEIVRSALQEMLPQALAQTVAPMQAELAELRTLSLSKTPQIKKEETPKPRSLSVNLVQQKAIDSLVKKTKSQFDVIAEQSVGLY